MVKCVFEDGITRIFFEEVHYLDVTKEDPDGVEILMGKNSDASTRFDGGKLLKPDCKTEKLQLWVIEKNL